MSGGGGGKAIGYLIENAESNHDTLMVNSTPIVIRSLTGVFPQSFRDLTLVAGTIGDYAAIVVGKDSPINSMEDLLAAFDADPSATAVGGGSVPGGMDHLVAAFAAPGLPEEKLTAYQQVISDMYETPEWEEIRAQNGWVNIHNSGDDFKAFLEDQEAVMGDLMKKLGFL